MNFFIELIKYLILTLFPLFLYKSFEGYDKDKNALLNILIVSIFLVAVLFLNDVYFIIFLYVPYYICYLKKKKLLGTLVLISSIVFLYNSYGISIYLLILQFISFLVLLFTNKKEYLFLTFSTYFYSLEVFIYVSNNVNFIYMVLLALITCLIYILIEDFILVSKYQQLEKTYNAYLFKFIHEIKNHLSICKGYLEMYKSKNSKNKKDYLEHVTKSINESLDIMEDYLLYGRYNVQFDYLDANLLLNDVYNDFKSLYDGKNVVFERSDLTGFNWSQVPAVLLEMGFMSNYNEDEIFIKGDYNKLKQVLVNIIKNGIEAKKDKKRAQIRLSIDKTNSNVIIEIKDNGIGIKNLDKLGNEFYTTKNYGTGLGVSFSKHIIDLHNGDIKYISNKDGTTVKISLPIQNI